MLAPAMADQPPVRRVMISSTALDLPEHRQHARDACERMSMLPLVMEQMPASPSDACFLSRRYVDEADIYLGIFAFRYGFVPKGQDKSITEMEYEHAIERKVPVFIFIAHDDHPVSFHDVERGIGAPKLETLKARLRSAHVVRTFRSAEELRTEVISALSAYRQNHATRQHDDFIHGADPSAHDSVAAVLIRPTLMIVYRREGWYLQNTGRGPSLNTIVAQKVVKGPHRGTWVNPVRVPTLAVGQEVLLTWLGHENDTGLGATYEDEDGRIFTSLTGNDLTRTLRSRGIPIFEESVIRRHWEVGIGLPQPIGGR
jgi:hypothetical protein